MLIVCMKYMNKEGRGQKMLDVMKDEIRKKK